MASNQNQTSIRAVFGALFLALWLAALDQTVVSTALPTMVGDLGGLSYLSWVVTAYLLTSTVAGPLYGKFGDLYGRKIVLQVAIAVFLVGSALCGIAQNMLQLIVFRALEGAGARVKSGVGDDVGMVARQLGDEARRQGRLPLPVHAAVGGV